ncbi:MAG: NADH-ubiquinone oxidoreductase-F iron-sulfur binding region domain-containing protein [Lentisphaerota bacterium]
MIKRQGPILFSPFKSGSGLARAFAMKPEEVIHTVDEAKLRGRGGAGFPAATKWRFALTEYGNPDPANRYVVCNADEGEPGTFKDRVLLTEYADLLIEGMLIAGYALSASNGIIYLRGEYLYMLDDLHNKKMEWRKAGKLGQNIDGKGFNFDIKIRMGAGAYVCGEETALIESLEGHRGEPRNRPPFPVNVGFKGKPTIVNNVETLCLLPHIFANGAGWFRAIGTEQSTGTKLISVAGDVGKPGVYEVPFGTTIADILEMVDAVDVKVVQVGGASGSYLAPEEFNRRICYEDVATGGAFAVFNKKRRILRILENIMEFFVEESCGQCTPCRYGNECLLEGVRKMIRGECTEAYLDELLELCETMSLASKCGLGQSSPNAFRQLVKHFRDELMWVDPIAAR